MSELEPPPNSDVLDAGADDADVTASAPRSPVEAALADLDRLSELGLAEHPDVYERVHTQLQRALSAIDDT
jgi:hypothetical protein